MLEEIKIENIITTVITAVDVMNPILKHHHRHTAIIAYHIGLECGLSDKCLAELVIAASLHDIGALTVVEASKLIELDVEDPKAHELLGSLMLSGYSAFEEIAAIIKHHHIHYDQCDKYTIYGELVKMESFILHLSDRVDILLNHGDNLLSQSKTIINEISALSATLFDPSIVEVFKKVAIRDTFWLDITNLTMKDLMHCIQIDLICEDNEVTSIEELVRTLIRIVDYKSAFTASHSTGVAEIAYEIAKLEGLNAYKCKEIHIAALLHDIGKIAVPTEIISKEGMLTDNEYHTMKTHAYYTSKILGQIEGLEEIAQWASSHHEKKDGTGYPNHIEELPKEVEIISYADIFTALCETRPYRRGLEVDEAMEIIKLKYKDRIGTHIYDILDENRNHLNQIRDHAQKQAFREYGKFTLDSHY